MTIIFVVLFTLKIADAQWRSETHDVYNAVTGLDVTIDGKLDEWDGIMDAVTGTDGTPFCGLEFEANGGVIKVFETYQTGVWNNADDHTTCFMIAWDADSIYLALSVTDDEHEHAAGAAWNGDGAQLSFVPSGNRAGGQAFFLYNAGLRDNGDVLLQNERTNGAPGLEAPADFAVTRDDGAKMTYYEFRVGAANLGLDNSFSAGDEIGLGICVNDGDKGEGQTGQKGWDGWYPHAVVYGKNPEKTGLVVLSSNTPTPVEPADKLTSTWGKIKSVK